MNPHRLDVSYAIESGDREDARSDSLPLLVPSLRIDGHELLTSCTLDLRELVASARCSGDFWIFICGCGTPGCGVKRTVEVTHSQDRTRWVIPQPIHGSSSRDRGSREVLFDGRQYVEAVRDALAQVHSLVETRGPNVEIGPYGFSITEIPSREMLDEVVVGEIQWIRGVIQRSNFRQGAQEGARPLDSWSGFPPARE